MKERLYAIPESQQRILLTKPILGLFKTHRQQGLEAESGGLLFAEFDFPIIRIVEVSPPHKSDKCWRTLFIPNRVLQRQYIKQRFKQGLHFVGEWHTHPQDKPSPSDLDLESMADSFLRSHHELSYFVMIIVGKATDSLELWVSVHNGNRYIQLKEEPVS